MPEPVPFQNLVVELRRGALTMAVLGCLHTPRYGYALLQTLQEAGVAIEANTLYPLLRRLEAQGLLTSDWELGENRPRKYYTVSSAGKKAAASLTCEWQSMCASMARIYGKGE